MKKTISLILAALLSVTVFCSCNTKEDNNSSAPENSKAEQSSMADSSAEESSEAEQSSEPEVRGINDMGIVEVVSLVRAATDISYTYSEITAESCERYFGKGFEFTEALFCEPMIGFGFSLCIARVDSDKVEEVAQIVEENADIMKWVCTGAEAKKVATNGDYVLLIMSTTEECDKVVEAFEAIGK